jgi:insertion element IS1 protein InsB
MRCIHILVKKNYCWIWSAVDRYGKRFIDFIIGSGGNETAEEFCKKIKGHEMNYIASDYWKTYESIILKEKHIQSKKETFTVEGHNSLSRHDWARMRRKSKCYSKKMEMLTISI